MSKSSNLKIKVKSLIIIIIKLINFLNILLKKILIFKLILNLKNKKIIYIIINNSYKIINIFYKIINIFKNFIIKIKNIKNNFLLI